jgi:hypothetical protein
MADYTSIHTGLEVDSAVTSMQLLTGGAGLDADILITNNKFFKGETGFGSLPTNLIGITPSDRVVVSTAGFFTDILGNVGMGSVGIGDLTISAALHLPNNSYMTGRNFANSGDFNIIKLNADDEVEIGSNLRLNSGDIQLANTQYYTGTSDFGSIKWNLLGLNPSERLEVGQSNFAIDLLGPTSFGGELILTAPTVPATAAQAGSIGQIAWDADFIYVSVAANDWRRIGIATWP